MLDGYGWVKEHAVNLIADGLLLKEIKCIILNPMW